MSSIADIRVQLWILGLIRATEAMAWSSIFPYAYYMIRSFDVAEHDVAFYAGVLVGVFTFAEFLTGVLWARVSDRIGRKPTLMIGTLCGAIGALAFGLSSSVTAAIASRAFGGLFNPNVGLVQTCTGELARGGQQAKAFSLVTFIRSLGNLIGPVLGGLLADPVALYPSIFASSSVFSTHRYLLPNLVIASLQIVTLLLTFFFLCETHRPTAHRHDPGLAAVRFLKGQFRRYHIQTGHETYAPIPASARVIDMEMPQQPAEQYPLNDQDAEEHTPSSTPEETTSKTGTTHAFTRQVILQILAVSLLAFHKVSSDALTGTFLALAPASSSSDPSSASFLDMTTTNTTRTANQSGLSFPLWQQEDSGGGPGGFGLDSLAIGLIFLAEAAFRVAIQPALVPWFIARCRGGTLGAFRWVLAVYPAAYLATPFLPGVSPPPLGVALLVLDLWVKVALSAVGYVCSAVLITNASPSSEALARINGAAASVGCLARSVGPLLTGKLSAVGLQTGYLQVPFWTLGCVALAGAVESLFLLDGGRQV